MDFFNGNAWINSKFCWINNSAIKNRFIYFRVFSSNNLAISFSPFSRAFNKKHNFNVNFSDLIYYTICSRLHDLFDPFYSWRSLTEGMDGTPYRTGTIIIVTSAPKNSCFPNPHTCTWINRAVWWSYRPARLLMRLHFNLVRCCSTIFLNYSENHTAE